MVESAGWQVECSAPSGKAAVGALDAQPAAALVLDVALPDVHAFEVVEEARRRSPQTRVVLVASVYNRTGYKRRPTSLYGADDYVEQHHIPDSLVGKLQRLIGAPPRPVPPVPPHAETPEGRSIREAGEHRIDPFTSEVPSAMPSAAEVDPQLTSRAERLAWLIVSDIALYNGAALDGKHLDDKDELEARLRLDLEEGRLLFDIRVPAEVRRRRDYIGEALDRLRAERPK